mmetsp:Transcript_24753/g.42670  ORF Transcript_24753/g.42670 Transcript_24753/m.42670 type:complete len:220 (-) Transcript_24753:1-660(-)
MGHGLHRVQRPHRHPHPQARPHRLAVDVAGACGDVGQPRVLLRVHPHRGPAAVPGLPAQPDPGPLRDDEPLAVLARHVPHPIHHPHPRLHLEIRSDQLLHDRQGGLHCGREEGQEGPAGAHQGAHRARDASHERCRPVRQEVNYWLRFLGRRWPSRPHRELRYGIEDAEEKSRRSLSALLAAPFNSSHNTSPSPGASSIQTHRMLCRHDYHLSWAHNLT